MKKLLTITAVAMALALALTGCGNSGAKSNSSQAELTSATVYIGIDNIYKGFPLQFSGEPTPETLLSAITAYTGWNLDLSDEITSGKDGMTVSFADTSALVAGPPDPQVEEFFVYDNAQLIQAVLGSVKRTLQYNFVDPEKGDPKSLDIYFALNGEDITVPGTDIVISSTEPYDDFPKGE